MRSAIIAIIAALGGAFVACQDSDVSRDIGARCDRTAECNERCLTPGTDYPGGFCTLACASRNECPGGTTCADRDGGVCLFECSGDTGCLFLGSGWGCKSANLRGGGVQVMVCRGS